MEISVMFQEYKCKNRWIVIFIYPWTFKNIKLWQKQTNYAYYSNYKILANI